MDKTTRVLRAMARENTGRHLLDSGSAYGYIYDSPLPSRPISLSVNHYPDAIELEASISLVHMLADALDYDNTSQRFTRSLAALWSSPAHAEHSFRECIAEFIERVHDDSIEPVITEPFNTYNDESDLDQHFQGDLFAFEGDVYAVIQTHNGCDIRGGYSRPKVFRTYDAGMSLFESLQVAFYCPSCADEFEPSPENAEIIEMTFRVVIKCKDCGTEALTHAGNLVY